jgi:glutamyl-tRNA reductase
MSDLILVHRSFSNQNEVEESPFLVWKTCLRQIFFLDLNDSKNLQLEKGDEVFRGLEAESFLAEVLCGLKSPLIGETEVFGQFKFWWKSVPEENLWKQRHRSRIEALFSVVKGIREKILCGQGSQSYGSLLRRYLTDPVMVDILGAGHLAQEIAPWIQKQSTYRIWCRNPQKLESTALGSGAKEVISLTHSSGLSRVVVIAAPMDHRSLNTWLRERDFGPQHLLFDFRSDSGHFIPFVEPKAHFKLEDFSSQYEEHRSEIEKKAQKARNQIHQWRDQQESRSQLRPYGWDDL